MAKRRVEAYTRAFPKHPKAPNQVLGAYPEIEPNLHQENGRLVFCIFVFWRVSSAVFISVMVSQPCLCLSRIIFGLPNDISGSFQISGCIYIIQVHNLLVNMVWKVLQLFRPYN